MAKIKAAVIGHPIKHSNSPIIHNFLLEAYDIDGSYEKIEILANNLKKDVDELIKQGFKGFNVTIPHKEEIFKLCNYVSKSAFLLKAVNTVVITQDQKIFGHNSDADGFIDNLKYHISDLSLNNKKAFVIGAGGASRAVIYSLIKEQVKEIYITNRSQDRVDKIITDFAKFCQENNSQIIYLKKDEFSDRLDICDILINASSLGMDGQDQLELNIKNLNSSAIVYDIVYKPLMTKLLTDAKANGNKIVTGIGMLVFQALIGFELFFGQKPEEKYIKSLLTKIS